MATADLPDWVKPPGGDGAEGEGDGTAASAAAAAARKAFFEVLKPGATTKEKVALGSTATGAVVFGRNPEASDALLEHPSISRRHAAVLHDGKGGLFLYDWGSTHGTFLDGRRVPARAAQPLREGSRVKFAESSRTYILRLPAAVPAAAAAPAAAVDSREALEQLPLAFGGSKKTFGGSGSAGGGGSGNGALSKDAMAAGIAEMMKEIEAAEQQRQAREEAAAANGDGAGEEEEESEEEEDFGPAAPPAGGGPKDPAEAKAAAAAAWRARAAATAGGGEGEVDGDGDGEEKKGRKKGPVREGAPQAESVEDTATRLQVPMSHEVALRGHHKSITCIALDPAGARVAVGGMDYKLLLYDFGGMDRAHRPFRDLTPEDGSPVVAVSFSVTGDRLLVATGAAQARVYDRDGVFMLQTAKGDPYIADMANTKGHTMALTGAQWHPQEKDTIMTASLDGTVRLWDLNGPRNFTDQLQCKRVIKARSRRNTAVPVTCAQLSPAGDWVAAGAQDGSVQCFSLRKTSWFKPDVLIRPAHGPEAQVTAVAWAPDGRTLASRGYDGAIKLWDTRKPAAGPLRVLPDIATHYDSANLAFSPDGRLLCAGTNVPPGEGTGTLKFWDVSNNGLGSGAGAGDAPVLTMGVAPQASVTSVLWHRRLKQLVCGTSAGATKVLYDPAFSVKGALMSANRVKRASDPMDAGGMLSGAGGGVPVVGKIINPGALPMYREEGYGPAKRKRLDRMDPLKSRKPEMPVNGPGAQGRLGDKGSFTQHYMQHRVKNTLLEEDPREAILKYAEKAKEGVQLVGRAYAKTAPVTPFQGKTLEQEVEDAKAFEQEILKK